MRWSSS